VCIHDEQDKGMYTTAGTLSDSQAARVMVKALKAIANAHPDSFQELKNTFI